MDDLDFYRRQLTITRVDADMAKSSLFSTQLKLKLRENDLQAALKENESLRGQINQLESQIQAMAAHLDEVKASFKQVPMEDMIKSLIKSIESGSKWDGNLAIANASAEICVALQVSRNGASILAESPGVYPVDALSKISFDLRTSPPNLTQELKLRQIADIKLAVLNLQKALDRELPDDLRETAGAVIAKAGEFAANSSINADSIKVSIEGLVKSINVFSQHLQDIAPLAKNLTEIYSNLLGSPSDQELGALAKLIGDIAHSLQGER